MNSSELLIEAFDRIKQTVHGAIDGASDEVLNYRADANANTIAWLVWHLTRVQDDHLADAFDGQQVWSEGDWASRFALPFADGATGYGQSRDEVGAVRVSATLLGDYHDAVHARSVELLGGVSADDLERVVDASWNPPVTLGVRLLSVISDDLQHAGQAAYVRGLAKRAAPVTPVR